MWPIIWDFRADPDRACFRQDSIRGLLRAVDLCARRRCFLRNDGDRFAEVAQKWALLRAGRGS